MKKLIIPFALLLLVLRGFGQNYSSIIDTGTYYFSNDTIMHAIRIDSVKIESGDTLYYNYPNLKYDNSLDCYTTKRGSWLGQKILKRSDWNELFFNEYGDTIILKANVNVGESWIFLDYNEVFDLKYKVVATITTIDTLSFLGMNDSVMVINLEVQDSSGNRIEHWINERTIILSKHYGMIKTLELVQFPEYFSSNFNLIAIGNNINGETHIRKEDIYNYDFGDEFHTHYVISDGWMELYRRDIKKMTEVIEKYTSVNGDTINYIYSICVRDEQIDYEWDTVNNIYIETNKIINAYTDTIDERIIFSELDFPGYLPGQPVIDEYSVQLILVRNNYGGYFSMNHIDDGFVDEGEDCLYIVVEKSYPFNPFNDYPAKYSYVEGCGAYHCENHLFSEDCYTLEYYKKGEKTWGTPYNCEELLYVSLADRQVKIQLKVYPNPTQDILNIDLVNNSLTNRKITVQICDVLGKIHLKKEFHSCNIVLDCSDLDIGGYMVLLYSDNQIIGKSTFIKK